MKKLIIASGNTGKIKEFQQILATYQLIPQSDFHILEAEESGLSFVENAIIKARHASKYANLPAIADDSGLIVDSLGGAPGLYSARYSDGNDNDNITKLLNDMKGSTNRKARFYCAIVFVVSFDDQTPIIATASWEGEILSTRIGKNGFGYDNIFFIAEKNCTSAQLSLAEKNKISHRAKALKVLENLLCKKI